jgi:flagellar biosynthesis chaperone FliJ
MSYERLYGMGAAGVATASGAGMSTTGSSMFSNLPPLTAPAAAPARTTPATATGPTAPAATPAAAAARNTISIVGLGIKAIAVKPKIPSGSVATKAEERTELKEWCRQTLGQNGAFYKEKLKTDPNFTYMNANTLSKYRNSGAVVTDMFRGQGDSAATASDVTAFKTWWAKCHLATWVLFKLRQKSWYKNDSWVPLKLSTEFKRLYKTNKACPTGTAQRSLFEYLTTANASTMLKETKVQQDVQAKADADAVKKALAIAKAEQDRLKKEADKAKKVSAKLNETIIETKNTIDQLNQKLAGSVSASVVTDLQAQITALQTQLANAQAQAPAVQAEAQAAEAVAVEVTQEVAQVEQVAQEVVAQSEPWYIQYKWHLLAGAAALAGGAYWYMNKQKAAAPVPTKNWLPEPTSPRHPSGLRRNRRAR